MDRSQPSLRSSHGSALGRKSYKATSTTNGRASIVYAPARSRVFPVQLESPQAKFLILVSHRGPVGVEYSARCRRGDRLILGRPSPFLSMVAPPSFL